MVDTSTTVTRACFGEGSDIAPIFFFFLKQKYVQGMMSKPAWS